MEKYVRVINGEQAGDVLKIAVLTDSGKFLDCRDCYGNRYKIDISNTTAASENEIQEFEDKSNTAAFF